MELSESQKAITIMLVDDSVINHYIVKTIFRKEGFEKEVTCFESAAEALIQLDNMTASHLPDVILLDINMPGMNGFDFLEAFDQLSITIKQKCKVVMLTSSMSSDDIARASANPYVKFYLHKPLTTESISQLLTLV